MLELEIRWEICSASQVVVKGVVVRKLRCRRCSRSCQNPSGRLEKNLFAEFSLEAVGPSLMVIQVVEIQ